MSGVTLPPSSLSPILQTMIEIPETRSHMLFLGPPGCGKTTSANSFATALHGRTSNKFASLLFLNSSDERSLEVIRQKIYPFVESRMQSLFFTEGQAPPKVIIFDEAETLTDQAQCALRPLLQRSTKDVLLIFICNSLSHIHPEILNKFLVVPFAPTESSRLNAITHTQIPKLDSLFRRGDIRFFKQCPGQARTITTTLSRLLHASNSQEVVSTLTSLGTPLRERVTWFLLFHQAVCPPSTDEIALWSALTASETQPYLQDADLEDLSWKLWCQRMASLTSLPAVPQS
jgi:replication-associated recombination protein RarA